MTMMMMMVIMFRLLAGTSGLFCQQGSNASVICNWHPAHSGGNKYIEDEQFCSLSLQVTVNCPVCLFS